jgi:hypothetical protein
MILVVVVLLNKFPSKFFDLFFVHIFVFNLNNCN